MVGCGITGELSTVGRCVAFDASGSNAFGLHVYELTLWLALHLVALKQEQVFMRHQFWSLKTACV